MEGNIWEEITLRSVRDNEELARDGQCPEKDLFRTVPASIRFLYSLSVAILSLLARLWHIPSSPVGSLALAWSDVLPHKFGQGSALTDLFISNWCLACARLTLCLDYRGSMDLWNVCKLTLVNRALQHRRWPSLSSLLWEPQITLHYPLPSNFLPGM
jgi:hypothetical protein